MNSTFNNYARRLFNPRKRLTLLLTESALVAVISMALIATVSLQVTHREIKSLSIPNQHNDYWQMSNVAFELQQLERIATRFTNGTDPSRNMDQLRIHIDILLSTLSPDINTPHSSTAIISGLPEVQKNIALINENLLHWSAELSSPTEKSNVPQQIIERSGELATRAHQTVLAIHLATSQDLDNKRLALYKRFMQLRWVLTAILLGMTIVVIKLIVDRRLTTKLSRGLALLNKKLEKRVARRTLQLVEGRALLLFILDACPSEVALVQAETGKVHFINRELRERLNQGVVIDKLFIKDLLADESEQSCFMEELEQFGRVDNWETQVASQEAYWMSLSVKLVEVEGELSHLLWGFDISRHKELLQMLESQAQTDVLTALFNRRAFYEYSAKEIESSNRYNYPCSLLMLDIDYFKLINDKHGHAAGDEAIRVVSKVLTNSLRDIDIIGRVGGEEFAVTLPHSTQEQALETADRLRLAIQDSAVKHDSGEISLTVSIGISSCQTGDLKSIEELISSADQALYRAKNAGRNRVAL